MVSVAPVSRKPAMFALSKELRSKSGKPLFLSMNFEEKNFVPNASKNRKRLYDVNVIVHNGRTPVDGYSHRFIVGNDYYVKTSPKKPEKLTKEGRDAGYREALVDELDKISDLTERYNIPKDFVDKAKAGIIDFLTKIYEV